MIYTGSFVSTASGSVGGITASRNKGGQYLRSRAVPTTSTTAPALQAKAFMASASAAWDDLTEVQRDAWRRYGTIRQEVNKLGQVKILTGIAAHNRSYTRMARAALTPLLVPPIGSDPDALATYSATFDIGAGTTLLAFTPTPIGATRSIYLEAALVDSVGIEYVQSVKRLCVITAANQATGYDYSAAVQSIFGTLTVGQKLVLMPRVFDRVTGLLSQPVRIDGTIVST